MGLLIPNLMRVVFGWGDRGRWSYPAGVKVRTSAQAGLEAKARDDVERVQREAASADDPAMRLLFRSAPVNVHAHGRTTTIWYDAATGEADVYRWWTVEELLGR